MKKAISISYPVIANMGDLLNEVIVEKIFGYEVKKASPMHSDMSGIGSSLGSYMYSNELKRRIQQFIMGTIVKPTVSVWGTGFVAYDEPDAKFFRRNIKIYAVRGELSRKKVERILGRPVNVPTGDGGLLSSYLLEEKVEKKYDIGIIAHFKEQDEPIFGKLVEYYPNSTFIDVKRDPITVIKHIAQCRSIISSSLHGLIISDSLRVPNIHIKVSSKLIGDGYKFDDYYSAFLVPHQFIDGQNVTFEELPSIEQIIDSYQITDEMIIAKQKGLIEAFPFPANK